MKELIKKIKLSILEKLARGINSSPDYLTFVNEFIFLHWKHEINAWCSACLLLSFNNHHFVEFV